MFDNNLLERLPANSEDGFAFLEAHLRAKIPIEREIDDYNERREYEIKLSKVQLEYILALAAYIDTHSLEIDVDFDYLMTLEGTEFKHNFDVASRKIQFFANKCAFKLSQKQKSATTCIYIIDEASKLKIRQFIENIKVTLQASDITDLRKEALFTKLNAFADELDKDRTKLEAFTSFYVALKKEGKEIVNQVASPIEKIWSTVSSGGTELWKALPSVEFSGKIGFTPKIEDKSIATTDLDGEIPF